MNVGPMDRIGDKRQRQRRKVWRVSSKERRRMGNRAVENSLDKEFGPSDVKVDSYRVYKYGYKQ